MSNREIEKLSYRETHVTKETEDVPLLATPVRTVQEAVQLSLQHGLSKECLFIFARALKAFEITLDRRLPPNELESVFSLWWSAAKPELPSDAEFDEWRFDFEETFAKTHAPLGANSLEVAIRRADASPMPPQAARYPSPKIKRLVSVCYHLQLLQGPSPFFLGVRDAAKVIGTQRLPQASAWLAGLVRDGILSQVEKGTRKRATRFRFNLPQPVVTENTDDATLTESVYSDDAALRPPMEVVSISKPAMPPSCRKPSTYDLAERKKALQALINDLGHKDSWSPDKREQYQLLARELKQVNTQLAGLAD